MPRSNTRPLLLAGLVALATSGCANDPSPAPLPDGATACQTPRPQMCTMDYRPAVGFDARGNRVGSFGNHCRACAEKGVTYTLPQDRN